MKTSDPMTELVVNAIGYGVMMALEDRDGLIAKLQTLPSKGTLADALVPDAEGFIQTRADLVSSVREMEQR